MNFIKKNSHFLYLVLIFLTYSCEEILLEVDITNDRVELFAPPDSSTVAASNTVFEWDAIEGATAYRIQIVTPGFADVEQFLVNEIVEETSYSKNLSPGKYAWKITALNSEYESQFATASFEVKASENFSNVEVFLIKPVDGSISNRASQQLTWEAVENASYYRIQILAEENVIFETSSDTTKLDYVFDNGTFDWQVRAETEIENTFYTRNSIVIDTLKPEMAELISPENDTTFTANTVNFEWSRESTSGTNVIDSIYIYDDVDLENMVEKDAGTGSYFTILDRGTTYYWFIRSFDEAGNESRSSENFSFTIN